MLYFRKKLETDLHIFLGIIGALIIIGGLFIYSSSSVFSLEMHGSSHYFVKKQFWGALIGFFGVFFLRIFPVVFIKRMAPFFMLATLGLTALTLLPAFSRTMHGSSRWLNLGSFSFQPSELLKIAVIIFVAYWLEGKNLNHKSFWIKSIPLFCLLGLTCYVLLKQPDFGLTVTLMGTVFLLFFIAQFSLRYTAIALLGMAASAITLIYIQPYRMQRILTFLNPWQDPTGKGFQIIQSLIAIGSGNWLGTGIAHSKQKYFYLPMQHTDFIFSIIAEETGFIGCIFLIMLYMLFLYFGIRIAWQLKTEFATLTTLGFVLLTTLQAGINMAVASGLLPTKGLGLPFISYGNTALICHIWMIGIIIALVHDR